uniref:C-type lectin domain-containing protein n=1 Tax=Panagrellus redivivus TaxID=6233 RepID=A0A7E4ZR23_PANRE
MPISVRSTVQIRPIALVFTSCTVQGSVSGNLSRCDYYLKQSTNLTVKGIKLVSNIDIAIQNAVYDSQEPCPDGWTNLNTTCYLDVSQSTCNEYASFLEVSYDDGCNIPLMDVIYSCPDSTFTLGSYTDGHYCLKVIPKWSKDTDIGNMTHYEMANQYCYDETGGHLASIHSQDENDDFNSIQSTLEISAPGVMIGLITNSDTAKNSDDLFWLDGTGISYTNYYFETKAAYVFICTIMTSTGKWNSNVEPNNLNRLFNYIACKQNSVATMTTL